MEFNPKKAVLTGLTCLMLAGCAANQTTESSSYLNQANLVNSIANQLSTTPSLETLVQDNGSLLIAFPEVQAFSFDGESISGELQAALSDVVNVLIEYPKTNIDVLGHTDNIGNTDYNDTLSENRALQVGDYLIQQGILASRVTASGMGPSAPIADNSTAAGRAANRRVELIISE